MSPNNLNIANDNGWMYNFPLIPKTVVGVPFLFVFCFFKREREKSFWFTRFAAQKIQGIILKKFVQSLAPKETFKTSMQVH